VFLFRLQHHAVCVIVLTVKSKVLSHYRRYENQDQLTISSRREKLMKNKVKVLWMMIGIFFFFSLVICFLYAAPSPKSTKPASNIPGTHLGQLLRKLPDLVPGGQYSDPYYFCAMDNQNQLVILVKNQGNSDAPASAARIEFLGSNFVNLTIPPVPQNTTVPLQPISIPKACYQSFNNYDCNFNIVLDTNNQVTESNENNNIGKGKCWPPARMEVKLSAGTKPGEFNSTGSIGISVKCPTKVYFTGRINVTSMKLYPLNVKYQFARSDGASGPVKTVVFNALGIKEVSDSWAIIKTTDFNGAWEQLKILEPLNFESNKASFRVTCTGQ
jgi:hypothetical protein